MIAFTDHAVARYFQRIPIPLSFDLVLARGRVQTTRPAGLQTGEGGDAYLICGDAIFPLRQDGPDLVATTCLHRRRWPKADRRAFRDQRREEREWA